MSNTEPIFFSEEDKLFATHGSQEFGSIGYYDKSNPDVPQGGTFTFTKLIKNVTTVVEAGANNETYQRCDPGMIGPCGWHQWNADTQLCNCGSTDAPNINTGSHVLPFGEISGLACVLGNYGGNAIVTYMEYKDAIVEETTERERHTVTARTLQELMRLLMEWEYAVDQFECVEPHALAAKAYLAGLNIPPEVRAWLWDEVPPNKVQRFLEGNPNPRDRVPPPPAVGTVFERWIVPLIIAAPSIGFLTENDWIES